MSTTLVIFNNVIPLALFVGLLLYLFFMQRKFNQKIKEVKEAHLLLSNYKDGLVSNILKVEKSYVLLNKDLDKKLKSVVSESNQKIETFMKTVNELIQKNDALLRQKDEIMKEFNNMADPLKASLQKTLNEIKSFQDSMTDRVLENEEDLKRVTKDLQYVTAQIQKMKDCIRERTVDFEL